MSDLFTMMIFMMAGLALGACARNSSTSPPTGEATVSAVDPFELSIRVGRMGVMLGQGKMALGMIADIKGTPLITDPVDDVSARRALYAELNQAVLTHNRLWVMACEFDVSIPVCQNMFEPGWMGLPFSHAPTWQQLDIWSAEMQGQVGSLSGVLCAMAEQSSDRKPLCPIE